MFRVQVIADSSGEWRGNGLTFTDAGAAEVYARDLFMRWTAVRSWRVIDADCAVIRNQRITRALCDRRNDKYA